MTASAGTPQCGWPWFSHGAVPLLVCRRSRPRLPARLRFSTRACHILLTHRWDLRAADVCNPRRLAALPPCPVPAASWKLRLGSLGDRTSSGPTSPAERGATSRETTGIRRGSSCRDGLLSPRTGGTVSAVRKRMKTARCVASPARGRDPWESQSWRLLRVLRLWNLWHVFGSRLRSIWMLTCEP